MTSLTHLQNALRPRMNIPFLAEIVSAFLIIYGLVITISSIGIQNIDASYQYDDRDPHTTTMPFLIEGEGDAFITHLTFTVARLHAERFVFGFDDCVQEMTVNEEPMEEMIGLCNLLPGHAITLNNLQAGANTLFFRIDDSGGFGGLSMRVSWLDPLLLSLLILLAITLCWIGVRITLAMGWGLESAILPALLVIAFALRLSLSWHGGFGGDIDLNRQWGRSAAELGLVQSYSLQVNPETSLPNYPPLSILMFEATDIVYRAVAQPPEGEEIFVPHVVMKIPAMLADLATVLVVFALITPLAGRRKSLIAAAVYALHPAIVHDSSVWGQTDAVFTLFLCIALLCMQRQRWLLLGMALMTAVLFKMQTIILLPLLLPVIALHLRRWLRVALGGLIVGIPVLLPFFLGGAGGRILAIYRESVGYYSGLSLNAYNFWVMLYSRDIAQSSNDLVFHTLSYRTIGLSLWLIVVAILLLRWRKAIIEDIRSYGKTGMLPLTAAMISYAFFLFNTEMHERYLFPFVAFSLPLLWTGRKGIILYAATSFLFLLNLTSIVSFSSWDSWLLQDHFDAGLPVAVATAHMFVFFFVWAHIHRYQRTLQGSAAPQSISAFWKRIRSVM